MTTFEDFEFEPYAQASLSGDRATVALIKHEADKRTEVATLVAQGRYGWEMS